MPISRRLLLGLPAAILLRPQSVSAADPGTAPAALIEHFYDALLAEMKLAKRLTFDQRYSRLAPAISETFDLALMTRIAVGPAWTQFAADQQQRLTAAFSRYTISVYANRFDGYGGERFEVTPQAVPNPNGVIVESRLVKANGKAVQLNYLMRQAAAGGWKVIDVYLSGTVSELATRRSEFLAVLQQGGADGLVRMLEQRIAKLRTG
ncbi:MAG TPA: ABC transporter substrate-binding protein [Stellaceae bacterium]|nr:ABC transporter substrate-binding protein [Stellaceae bacterium]